MDFDSKAYNALINVIKIRFAKELKESGIIIQEFHLLKNLATGKECYLLIVNNKHIRFVKPSDFISHFSRFLINSINRLDQEYNRLVNLNSNEYIDEVQCEHDYKMVDFYRYKQRLLLKKMQEIKLN